MTIQIFKAFWQKVSSHLTIEYGDEASGDEWQDEDGNKKQGMRKANTAKHGIVRTICGSCIEEATYCENFNQNLVQEQWRQKYG